MKILNLFSYTYGDFKIFEQISFEDFKNADEIILGHFTSSAFLNNIAKDGICPPSIKDVFSNKDMFKEEDKYYVYLTSHFDKIYSENAVKQHTGSEVLILAKISPADLELDNLFNRHSDAGIKLNNLEKIFEELQHSGAAQARTKKTITPENIFKVIDIETMNEIKIA